MKVLITDMQGKDVKTLTAKNGSNEVDLKNVPPGTYLLILQTSEGNHETAVIIKK